MKTIYALWEKNSPQKPTKNTLLRWRAIKASERSRVPIDYGSHFSTQGTFQTYNAELNLKQN